LQRRFVPQSFPGRIAVEILSRRGCRPQAVAGILRTTRRVLRALGRSGGVCLLFTDDTEIRRLNRRFRGINRRTDVLSFRWDPSEDGDPYLGDIAISLPAARRQAREAGWPLELEIRFLVLHAVLHLLGHDHETDSGEMNLLQERLARTLLRHTIPRARIEPRTGFPDRKGRKGGSAR
jgi:probable rRNA maturation factor